MHSRDFLTLLGEALEVILSKVVYELCHSLNAQNVHIRFCISDEPWKKSSQVVQTVGAQFHAKFSYGRITGMTMLCDIS
jgi:hypothetical protein